MLQEDHSSTYPILLVGEHQLFNEALKALIKQIFKKSNITIHSNFNNAHKELTQQEYKYLIIELLPGSIDSGRMIQLYRSQFPELIIIIISSIDELRTIQSFLDMGINCFLPKSSTVEQFKVALINTINGNKFISDEFSSQILNTMLNRELIPLTKKELEILKIVVSGKSVKATAEMLHLSIHTIVAHRRNIMRKLNIHGAVELVQYAIKNNIV
jgi:DNA-binding NarL/FixJ family response regulator